MRLRHGLLPALARAVAERPRAPAIDDRGEVLTYADLWGQAEAIGTWLRRQGVGVGEIVGLDLGKSADYVAALLGVWWAGAAFVPLPPELPAERRRRILEEAAPRVRLDRATIAAILAAPGELGEPAPPVEHRADDLAYVLYTSGSSGRPKGVMIAQRGIAGLLRAQVAAFGLGPRSRALLLLSLAFDASISDIGTGLWAGATLVIAEPAELVEPRRLVALLGRAAITHVDLPPALLPHLDLDALPRSLEAVILGGEAAAPALVRRLAARTRVINVYGPTEATICVSLCACDPAGWTRPLLGAPLPGVIFRVVDEALEEAPPGVASELLIGGEQLALGYLARPALTAERFIRLRGERLYRSGDRVVVGGDGSIEFLGRIDRQRKIGGVRIELGEIEAGLREHPAIAEAAALDGPGGVIAVYSLRPGVVAPADDALRRHLGERLPPAAIPRRLRRVEALPRGTSGKVDLGALAEALARGEVENDRAEGERGEGAIAAMIAGLWAQVLGVAPPRPADRFVDQGGSSLAALELVAAAEPRGIVLSAADLLANASLGELADAAARLRVDVRDAPSLRAEAAAALARQGLALESHVGEDRSSSASSRVDEDATILLTGATGFVGRHLAALLRRRHRGRILALVRGGRHEVAEARLERALADADEALGEEGRASAAIEVVLGDLAAPSLGLDERTWTRLAAEVDVIIHGGAQVHLARGFDALRPANLDGAAAILRLARAGRPRLLHHLSTLSVFVAASPTVAIPSEEDALDGTERVFGGYAQSKWAAEVAIREGARGRVPAVIHRLGLVTGDQRRGRGPEGDQLGLFLRGLVELGAAPAGHEALRIDVTPVCFAARALAALILEGPPARAEAPTTYHLASPEGASAAALIAALGRAGAAIEIVDRQRWRALARTLAGRSPAAAVAYLALGRCLDPASFGGLRAYDLFQSTGFEFGCARAAPLLAARGLDVPAVTPALLDRYVAAALAGGAR